MLVVRESDGLPLAGLRVSAWDMDGRAWSPRIYAQATTDRDGRCVLREVARFAQVDEPPEGLADGVVDTKESAWVTLRLGQGVAVRAEVRTAEGTPATDVELGFDVGPDHLRLYTGATPIGDGGTWVRNCRAGRYRLIVRSAGQVGDAHVYQDLEVATGAETRVAVTLPPLAPASVALRGTWPPGVTVEFQRWEKGGGSKWIRLPSVGAEARTRLSPGRHRLSITADGMPSREREVEVPPTVEPISLELPAPVGRVTLHLCRHDAGPIGSEESHGTAVAQDATGALAEATLTERGQATFHGLAPGPCRVWVGGGNRYYGPTAGDAIVHITGDVEVQRVTLTPPEQAGPNPRWARRYIPPYPGPSATDRR